MGEESPTSQPPTGAIKQLSAAMEHMRFAVTLPEQDPDTYGIPGFIQPVRKPRTDASNNPEKRSDPFQFGSRFLEEGHDIFEFNAWDHVQTDEAYGKFAEEQYARQRESPVDEAVKKKYYDRPELWWNKFYKNNTSNFFKDRKWLFHEFPILKELTAENASDSLILEVGAGVGNTAFPVMRQNQNPRLRLHACDFSKKAVEIMKANTEVDGSSTVGKFEASVWDITASPHPDGAPHLPEGIRANSVDVVILIFVFSALEPSQWEQAVSNIWAMLKPGGTVLFRDYGRGDLAQVRFKAGRYLEENFYIRGDGTRVYFFDEDQLKELWSAPCKVKSTESSDRENGVPGLADKEDADPLGQPQNVGSKFDIVHFGVDRRMLVNRQRRLKMYRCWMQAVFKKQGEQSHQMSDKVDE